MVLKYKKVKSVTVALIKMSENKEYVFKLTGPIAVGKELKNGPKGEDGHARKAAELVPVTDMETGEEGQIIVGTTLKSELEEAYPGESYIGRVFEIVKHNLREGVGGSRYRTYSVTEVSIEEGDIEEAREAAATDVDPPKPSKKK